MQDYPLSNSELWQTTKNKGFFYILENPVFEGCVKIGRTVRLPGSRAAELSSKTAVPQAFSVVYSRLVDDVSNVERTIHKQLDKYRTSDNREFFNLPVAEAKEKVNNVIANYLSTEYDGIIYRKKQDARWAMFFHYIEVPFQYIEEPIKIGEMMPFRPDFWLPDQNCHVIISPDFLGSTIGRMAAYCFALKTDKPVIQLWGCETSGPRDESDQDFHAGYYVTPEGGYDGLIEWGVCPHCTGRHLGHLGTPGFGVTSSDNNCQCSCLDQNSTHACLQWIYDTVNKHFA